jgi:hypothetical protein
MKKIITILAIVTLAVASAFSATTNISFNGIKDKAPEMNVTLKSKLKQTSYDLFIIYGSDSSANDFTDAEQLIIGDLNLGEEGTTDVFNIKIFKGNLNTSITFVTEITVNPFIAQVDGNEYATNNNLSVININDENQTTFSSPVKAGPNAKQTITTFKFHWDADKEIPAGDYISTNSISISVN